MCTQKQLRTSEAGERHGDLSPEQIWTTTHRNSLHCLAMISCVRRNSSQPVEIAIKTMDYNDEPIGRILNTDFVCCRDKRLQTHNSAEEQKTFENTCM